MSGIISSMPHYYQTPDVYKVVTPVYEGPLDLLLHLIEKSELDISKLALATVTDQFLSYIKSAPENAIEDVSSFLVVASRLIQIKSESLLPRPPSREIGEIDPGEALAQQLKTYKRFKELSNFLWERQNQNLHTYPRLSPVSIIPSFQSPLDISIEDIFLAAQYIFLNKDTPFFLNTVVPSQKITIRDQIKMIAEFIRRNRSGTFDRLFQHKKYRLEVVVTFIALLELVKRQIIAVHQDRIFGQIGFEPTEIWNDELSFESEFGE